MNELIWFNGEVMPIGEARVSIDDRGYQFADGVYEVVRLYKQSLHILRSQIDDGGAIFAASDSDFVQFGDDTYCYV